MYLPIFNQTTSSNYDKNNKNKNSLSNDSDDNDKQNSDCHIPGKTPEPKAREFLTQMKKIMNQLRSITFTKTTTKKKKRYHNFTNTLMVHDALSNRRVDRIWHSATMVMKQQRQQQQQQHVPNSDMQPTATTKATAATTEDNSAINSNTKTFIAISIKGDMFLNGQICRIIGLIVAIMNGYVDVDIIDCVFDENYPNLVKTRPAPCIGLVASEASYMTWEGKLKTCLTPGHSAAVYNKGFCQPDTLQRVEDWKDYVYQQIMSQWFSFGFDANEDTDNGDGRQRLLAEKDWTENSLIPWSKHAKQQLNDYRSWKENKNTSKCTIEVEVAPDELTLGELPREVCVGKAGGDNQNERGISSSLPSTNHSGPMVVQPVIADDARSIPDVYMKVLYHLRRVDSSGNWPSTTLKRQLVMASTASSSASTENRSNKEDLDSSTPFSDALYKANTDQSQERRSPYSYTEGYGGASGSFSVGYMPDSNNKQPKSNLLFPELVKAAFELEIALFPNRQPSSTIAINRNAQFRPHTDSGAGAGQSTSLIVGLGSYAGGELVVEGEIHNIQYNPIEFDGWKERHWTMPFRGERYSLVWFTPRGCEGVRGIDLDLIRSSMAECD